MRTDELKKEFPQNEIIVDKYGKPSVTVTITTASRFMQTSAKQNELLSGAVDTLKGSIRAFSRPALTIREAIRAMRSDSARHIIKYKQKSPLH